jgi:hypothetical protein
MGEGELDLGTRQSRGLGGSGVAIGDLGRGDSVAESGIAPSEPGLPPRWSTVEAT